MSNRKYLIENNILYSKQFGFQDGYSTEHALVLLGKQIIESMLKKRSGPLLEFYDLSGHNHFLVILPKKKRVSFDENMALNYV